MISTQSVWVSIHKDLQTSLEFRHAFLAGILTALANDELSLAKICLTEYINGTVGFEAVAKAMNHSDEELRLLCSPESDPALSAFFPIFAHLQRAESIELRFQAAEAIRPSEIVFHVP